MTLWGIDPASKKIAMFNGELLHFFGVKKTNRSDEMSVLRQKLEAFIGTDPETVVYVEEPVLAGARNIRSTILVAETVGMILGLPCRVEVVPVSSWKMTTVGKGNASKEDVSSWLKLVHPDVHAGCSGNQDLCDASAIYYYGRAMEAHR